MGQWCVNGRIAWKCQRGEERGWRGGLFQRGREGGGVDSGRRHGGRSCTFSGLQRIHLHGVVSVSVGVFHIGGSVSVDPLDVIEFALQTLDGFSENRFPSRVDFGPGSVWGVGGARVQRQGEVFLPEVVICFVSFVDMSWGFCFFRHSA